MVRTSYDMKIRLADSEHGATCSASCALAAISRTDRVISRDRRDASDALGEEEQMEIGTSLDSRRADTRSASVQVDLD